eukprot:gene24453-30803_t
MDFGQTVTIWCLQDFVDNPEWSGDTFALGERDKRQKSLLKRLKVSRGFAEDSDLEEVMDVENVREKKKKSDRRATISHTTSSNTSSNGGRKNAPNKLNVSNSSSGGKDRRKSESVRRNTSTNSNSASDSGRAGNRNVNTNNSSGKSSISYTSTPAKSTNSSSSNTKNTSSSSTTSHTPSNTTSSGRKRYVPKEPGVVEDEVPHFEVSDVEDDKSVEEAVVKKKRGRPSKADKLRELQAEAAEITSPSAKTNTNSKTPLRSSARHSAVSDSDSDIDSDDNSELHQQQLEDQYSNNDNNEGYDEVYTSSDTNEVEDVRVEEPVTMEVDEAPSEVTAPEAEVVVVETSTDVSVPVADEADVESVNVAVPIDGPAPVEPAVEVSETAEPQVEVQIQIESEVEVESPVEVEEEEEVEVRSEPQVEEPTDTSDVDEKVTAITSNTFHASLPHSTSVSLHSNDNSCEGDTYWPCDYIENTEQPVELLAVPSVVGDGASSHPKSEVKTAATAYVVEEPASPAIRVDESDTNTPSNEEEDQTFFDAIMDVDGEDEDEEVQEPVVVTAAAPETQSEFAQSAHIEAETVPAIDSAEYFDALANAPVESVSTAPAAQGDSSSATLAVQDDFSDFEALMEEDIVSVSSNSSDSENEGEGSGDEHQTEAVVPEVDREPAQESAVIDDMPILHEAQAQMLRELYSEADVPLEPTHVVVQHTTVVAGGSVEVDVTSSAPIVTESQVEDPIQVEVQEEEKQEVAVVSEPVAVETASPSKRPAPAPIFAPQQHVTQSAQVPQVSAQTTSQVTLNSVSALKKKRRSVKNPVVENTLTDADVSVATSMVSDLHDTVVSEVIVPLVEPVAIAVETKDREPVPELAVVIETVIPPPVVEEEEVVMMSSEGEKEVSTSSNTVADTASNTTNVEVNTSSNTSEVVNEVESGSESEVEFVGEYTVSPDHNTPLSSGNTSQRHRKRSLSSDSAVGVLTSTLLSESSVVEVAPSSASTVEVNVVEVSVVDSVADVVNDIVTDVVNNAANDVVPTAVITEQVADFTNIVDNNADANNTTSSTPRSDCNTPTTTDGDYVVIGNKGSSKGEKSGNMKGFASAHNLFDTFHAQQEDSDCSDTECEEDSAVEAFKNKLRFSSSSK